MDLSVLKDKFGPLPVWGWGVLLGAAVVGYMYWSSSRSAAASASVDDTSADSGVNSADVDPSTGLPYDTGTTDDSGSLTDAWGNSVDTRLGSVESEQTAQQDKLDTVSSTNKKQSATNKRQAEKIKKEQQEINKLNRELHAKAHSGQHAKAKKTTKRKTKVSK